MKNLNNQLLLLRGTEVVWSSWCEIDSFIYTFIVLGDFRGHSYKDTEGSKQEKLGQTPTAYMLAWVRGGTNI